MKKKCSVGEYLTHLVRYVNRKIHSVIFSFSSGSFKTISGAGVLSDFTISICQ